MFSRLSKSIVSEYSTLKVFYCLECLDVGMKFIVLRVLNVEIIVLFWNV